ncbi:hypothetical protein PTKU46_44640 [Paraburkholderia terrae]
MANTIGWKDDAPIVLRARMRYKRFVLIDTAEKLSYVRNAAPKSTGRIRIRDASEQFFCSFR